MVDPRTVLSPRDRLKRLRVIHETQHWSLAVCEWEGDPGLLMRWNGDEERPMGHPNSSGNPTWFAVPPELWWPTLSVVGEPERTAAAEWLQGRTPASWLDSI
ncbi:hypothetical protein GR702_05470 [Novosphingobium sp. FGD1]|uniref:Uncharacterized protein n=1 Tax=Novosphingobium silvae TaxID=2692619 RepID=A0A7X4GF26_9SPHN|nr:hypothetical protein [Novosphingobium silvae]MYL97220.1 hypothetical protein [Novosphingobium silvae]